MIVSSNRRGLATALVGLGVVAAVRVAAAAPTAAGDATAIAVRWSGSSDCERSERVRRRIAEDLGGRAPATATELDVRVAGAQGAWRADLDLRGATAVQRSIVAVDCDALADAVALVGVVALDPFALAPRVRATTTIVVPMPAAPTTGPAITARRDDVDPTARPRPPARVRERVHGALRIELGASGFGLPGIGAVVGLAPLVEGDRWRFEMPVRWSLPREEVVREGVAGRYQLVAANPRGCFVPGRGPVGVPLCGGVDLGAMLGTGRGDGLASTTTAASPWVAATLSVAVRWRVHRRFATWLAVEGAVPFGRPTFHVQNPGDAYQAGPATLLVAIGGEVHFSSSSRSARRTQRVRATIGERVHAFRDGRGGRPRRF